MYGQRTPLSPFDRSPDDKSEKDQTAIARKTNFFGDFIEEELMVVEASESQELFQQEEDFIDMENFSCEELKHIEAEDRTAAQIEWGDMPDLAEQDENERQEAESYFSKMAKLKGKPQSRKIQNPVDEVTKRALQAADIPKDKNQTLSMTKALPSSEVGGNIVFGYEAGMTFAICNMVRIDLFEGKLGIERKIISIFENYLMNGRVANYEVQIKFVLNLNVDGMVFTATVDLDTFDDGGFLRKMSEGTSTLEKGAQEKKLFAKYTKQLRRQRQYKEEIIFQTPGWKNYGTKMDWYYVLPLGVVGDPEKSIRADTGRLFGTYKRYEGTCIAADFLQMRDVFDDSREIAVVMQYYQMISLIKGLLRECGINPQFLVALIGETNSKKTTLATLFCKLYDMDSGSDIDFTATKVALEEAVAMNADAVTIFDDIIPPNTRAQEMEQKSKVEALTRTFGGNLPRKRSKIYAQRNPGVSEFTPVLGQGLLTGEVLPVTLKSSRSRILKLEIKRTDCNDQVLTHFQNHPEILPTFAVAFIEHVSQNQKSILSLFKMRFESERKSNSLGLKTPRYRETYAMFAAIVETFSEYLASTGQFTGEMISSLVRDDLAAIGRVVLANDNEVNQRPDEVLIAECMLDTKLAQEVALKPLNPLDQIYEDENLLVIYPQTLVANLHKKFDAIGRVYPYSSNSELYKFLEDKDIIKVVMEGTTKRHTHKYKAADGGERRFFKFFSEKLKRLVSEE